MPAPKTSKRPKARSAAPKTSKRPQKRPEMIGSTPSGSTRGIDPKKNYGTVKKKKAGGSCRGMGSATKGGRYGKMG